MLLIIDVWAGIAVFRRAMPGGAYEGTMSGAVSRGAILGFFLGIAGFLLTLVIVFAIRAVR